MTLHTPNIDRKPTQQEAEEALAVLRRWAGTAAATEIEARDTALTAEKSLPALREFVENGGTLIAMAGECDKVIRHFDLPLRVGLELCEDPGC